ncbi:hypothetical protein TEA_020870 [Camellia sinensis var. sinensis]|uniref:HMA domain-containing protein n=1 Tax=Camellia sinensis var. sinensis TaxID=542762 RepID=A0A4S4DYI1_CAMSN|nr:hypothetical protein TEA_020870 [Camellia sinensis var. sinensis]
MASSTSISGFSSLNSICSSKSHIHSSLSSSFPLGSLHRQSHGSSVNRNPTFALVLNNNKFQRWRNMVRSVVEETLVPEETDQPVSALTMFFQAEGTMNEAAIRTVTNALEETEGIANLKVQVVEGIASVEGSKIRISSAGNFRIVIKEIIYTAVSYPPNSSLDTAPHPIFASFIPLLGMAMKKSMFVLFCFLLLQSPQGLQPMLQHPAYAFIKTPVHAPVMTSTHVPVKVPTYAPIMVPTLPPAHGPWPSPSQGSIPCSRHGSRSWSYPSPREAPLSLASSRSCSGKDSYPSPTPPME